MSDQDYVIATDVSDEERTSGKAIASLVLGLMSPLLCLFAGIPALVCGILALGEINRSGGRVKGHDMAMTGAVLGGVATVIGILMAFSLNTRQAVRSAAYQAQSRNNMKQIGVAMHNYHSVYGCFPPAVVYDEQGLPMHSWRVLLLPYLDGREALYDQYDFDQPWDSAGNLELLEQMPSVYFAMPSNDRTTTSYVVIVGRETMFPPDDVMSIRDVTDGTSNTILVVEQNESGIPWTEPRDLDFEAMSTTIGDPQGDGIWSGIQGGTNVGMVDGSARWLREETPPEMVRAMLTRDGREIVSPPAP